MKWIPENCDFCGDCLVKCRYVSYDRDRAIKAITNLAEGKEDEILAQCVTCQACNEYCVKGANPWDRIADLQQQFGMGPNMPRKVQYAVNKTLDQSWWLPSKVTPGNDNKTVLNLSIARPTFPRDGFSGKLFDGLTKVRGGDYAGFMGLVKTGRGHPTEGMCQHYANNLNALGAEEIVIVLPDDVAMARYVQHHSNSELNFRPVNILEHLAKSLKTHRSSITKLVKKVAYHRNCMSRYMPEDEHFVDEIFNLIGVERVDRKYDRENAVCCGATMPDRQGTVDMNLSDALEKGAEALIILCPSCMGVLNKPCVDRGLKPIYISELCRMALGETPYGATPPYPDYLLF